MRRLAAFRSVIATALLLAIQHPATAQDWPTRPVTMVVPFAAGGPTDLIGRMMQARMSEVRRPARADALQELQGRCEELLRERH